MLLVIDTQPHFHNSSLQAKFSTFPPETYQSQVFSSRYNNPHIRIIITLDDAKQGPLHVTNIFAIPSCVTLDMMEKQDS